MRTNEFYYYWFWTLTYSFIEYKDRCFNHSSSSLKKQRSYLEWSYELKFKVTFYLVQLTAREMIWYYI